MFNTLGILEIVKQVKNKTIIGLKYFFVVQHNPYHDG